MMTEKRFYSLIHNINEDDEYYELIDREEKYSFNCIQDEQLADQVCHLLNEQQITINKLKCELLAKENEQLREDYSALMRTLLYFIKDDEDSEWINQVLEENKKLKELIKGNVFGKYREGSLADLNFKALAYDDIVKLEMFYESEPKVIVICKQGKKENVKSFCQIFIPFGVDYEIKEVC